MTFGIAFLISLCLFGIVVFNTGRASVYHHWSHACSAGAITGLLVGFLAFCIIIAQLTP